MSSGRETPDTPQADQQPVEFVSPGRFPIHNPRRDTGSTSTVPATPLLGQASLAEQALLLITQARRELTLYSTDFEPWLYSHQETADACKNFLLGSPHNRLRILLHDSSRMLQEGHRLLPLIERLSSRAEVRLVSQHHEQFPGCWLGCDNHSLLLRQFPERFEGTLYQQAPRIARRQLEYFDAMWAVARPDINLRRMLL